MESVVTLELPRHLVDAAKVTPEELKTELAIHLYETRRLSFGYAREMANLSLWEFRQLLASRKISPHYDLSDLDEDMRTWAELDNQTVSSLNLKETAALYNVAPDDILLRDEVIILEKDGQPLAALVPIAEYTAFQSWQKKERRRQARQAEKAAIEQEHAAFERMLPELLEQYEGQAVALYNGQVVDVGDDESEVWERTRQRLGQVPVYVQTVTASPTVYDLPSVEVVLSAPEWPRFEL